MAQAGREKGAGRGRERTWAIAFSILAHAVALGILAWTTPALRLPLADWRPDITVDLSRPVPQASRRAVSTAPASPRPASATALANPTAPSRRAPSTSPPAPAPSIPRRPQPAPAAPAPLPAPPAAAAGAPARPGTAPRPSAGSEPVGSGGDAQGAVRAAIGCNHEEFLHLTPAEKAACERKMAETPPHSGSYVDPIPPLKRGAYDRQAAADARRRDHEGPMRTLVVPCEGQGSNFGTGCLPSEASHRVPFGATPRRPAPDPDN